MYAGQLSRAQYDQLFPPSIIHDQEWATMQQAFCKRLLFNEMQPKDACRMLELRQSYRSFFEPKAIYMTDVPDDVKSKVKHAVNHPYIYSWQVIVPEPEEIEDVVSIFNEFHRAELDSVGINFIFLDNANQLIAKKFESSNFLGWITDESAATVVLQPCIEQMLTFDPSLGPIEIVFSHEMPLHNHQ